jgi:hypothetical protein
LGLLLLLLALLLLLLALLLLLLLLALLLVLLALLLCDLPLASRPTSHRRRMPLALSATTDLVTAAAGLAV